MINRSSVKQQIIKPGKKKLTKLNKKKKKRRS